MLHPVRFIVWILFAGVAIGAPPAPKIAIVRVSDVYRELDASKTLAAEIEVERNEIQKDPRLTAYRSVLMELDELQKGLAKLANADESTREHAEQNFVLKRQEALTLQREYEDFRKLRTTQINTRLVAQMEKILTEIRKVAEEMGEAKGYDWVLDTSGSTNTGMPFVLYSKNPDDITEDVLERLSQPVADAGGDESN